MYKRQVRVDTLGLVDVRQPGLGHTNAHGVGSVIIANGELAGILDVYKRQSENGTRYYTADKLNKAMSDALTANATTVKNALEIAVRNGDVYKRQVRHGAHE